MSELSSCYFCGTALDAPVRRYPVTPSDIDVDTGRTVALCPPCRRKLGKVLTLVAEEMDAVAVDSTAGADEGSMTAEMEEAAADDDIETSDEDEAVTGEEAGATEEDEEGTEEAAAGSVDEESGAEAVEATGEDGDRASDEHSDEATGGSIDESPAGTVEGADDEEGDAESGAESAGASNDESVEWGMPDENDEETELDAGDTAAEADAGETAGGDTGGGTPEALSTPSAKKVIRLLQNREFPVERDEFEVIAQNAYDIPLQDCQEVVDALVEEGYVGQKGGQLVREE